MKKYLAKLTFLLLILITAHSQDENRVEYFRSNYNGLLLLKITSAQRESYKYWAEVKKNDKGKIIKKILYQENSELKRWDYSYQNETLFEEKYFKDKVIEEEYQYDSDEHKVRQIEYKNGQKIRQIIYLYNDEGLVSEERIFNFLTNKTTNVKYRYDKNFKIKQIIKKLEDGRTIYWDSFFTSKGIIVKEYYTLDNETYIFYYNTLGQEIKGEVFKKENDREELIIEWKNEFAPTGLKARKEEVNLLQEVKKVTIYNNEGKEKKVDEYKNEELIAITEYEYNENGLLIKKKSIKDLEETIEHFFYNQNDDMIKKYSYSNDKLKKVFEYQDGKIMSELVFGENNINILRQYYEKGNVISKSVIDDSASYLP